ncbi:MAG: restriction endonuclease [Rhizobiales bacterium]|nr:restriction endonuclease [Hyphomicrobiales bacterium]
MAVPDYQSVMLPLLRKVGEADGETYVSALIDEVGKELELSEADVTQLVPSGRQTVFSNRLHWAKTYVQRAGLLESTRHGYFRITERGRQVLAEKPARINNAYLSRFPEFVEWKSRDRTPEERSTDLVSDATASPDDQIAASYGRLTKELSEELVLRMHKSSPSFFERLIIDLLVGMGYGGGRAEMRRALGRSGDAGIDGVIKEDELGLDVVYVQAKRYAPENGVPVREVRDFIGSLEGHRASKGVFVTTSYFPDSAIQFVDRVSKRVILIDGVELARLMIKHNVGVRIKDTYEIKKVDEDYFVE